MSTYKWSVPVGKEINGQTYIKDTDNKIYDTIADLVDFVNSDGTHTGKGLMYDFVDKASVQTISGVKTFSSGINANVTGNLTGNASGNASTATKLETARTISLTGDVTGSASFDGSNNTSITTTYNTQLIPSGAILLWSGSIASIPSGWHLCNGTNGTPNLTDRFIVGAGGLYSVASTGGSKDAIVVEHTHTGTTSTDGSHNHSYTKAINKSTATDYQLGVTMLESTTTDNTSTNGSHSHSLTINSTGSSGTNANLPPYYALAYIMKG